MNQTKEIDQKYHEFEKLINGMNWEAPSALEEATTRKHIESWIIDFVFTDEADIRFEGNVDESEVRPTDFTTTEKVEVKEIEEDGYKISAKISTINPRNKTNLFFEGRILESEGLVQTEPVNITES